MIASIFFITIFGVIFLGFSVVLRLKFEGRRPFGSPIIFARKLCEAFLQLVLCQFLIQPRKMLSVDELRLRPIFHWEGMPCSLHEPFGFRSAKCNPVCR